uniref:NADH-ubiquinone oxidoreductase chain 2 n=1 Tax=Placobdella lamothei TaxID=1514856 RepID=A0A175D0E7_9ANNE|nr:NADH dehydrogenase subunit 2 [Placobdella lamothei]CVK87340.1 NADH dehydrogenase subunit 2 [Placobdella lamothei]
MVYKFILSLSPMMRLSLLIMFISTMMAISSTNWLMIWVGLEINMLSFIPFMTKSSKQKNIEAVCKYLVIQACASCIMLYFGYVALSMFTQIPLNEMALVFAFTMKLGMFPAHYWFPSVLQSCDWAGGMMLATWQKVAPAMILISSVWSDHDYLSLILLLSITLGGLLGLNQTDAKAILAYSSVSHMGWFLMPHMCGMSYISYYYFLMYMLITLPIFFLFQVYTYDNPNTSSNIMLMPDNMKLSLVLMLLSLGGLPPLSGFIPKLMVIYSMMTYWPMLTVLVTMISCISLYFYLKLAMNIIMVNKSLLFNIYMDKYLLLSMTTTFLLTPFILAL